MPKEALCFSTAGVRFPTDPLQTQPLACQAAAMLKAGKRAACTLPSLYLQFCGICGNVPRQLNHLALLADEYPACTVAHVMLAAGAAGQENQQAGKTQGHLCLHICLLLLHLEGRSVKTSQCNSETPFLEGPP